MSNTLRDKHAKSLNVCKTEADTLLTSGVPAKQAERLTPA